MNYSDTTSALVINKLTKSQYETLKASGSLQSNQIYITPETLPSNLGDFNNDVGYVTASAVAASYATKGEVEVVTASVSSLESSVETLGSSVDAVSSQVTALASSISGKRDYLDLTYSYSSTTTLSYYDLYYGESYSQHYNDEDTTQQWGIQEIHVSIPSQLARDYEEWFEVMEMSLPDGYSSFPTEWTLTYVDSVEIGAAMDFNDTGLDPVENPQCAWLPMGEITVDGQTTNWTQYLIDKVGEPLLGMYLFKNATQDYMWYNLAAVESLDARFTTTQFSLKDVGSQTLTGTGEETDYGTYFNIPTTPFQMSFTWHDMNENERTDTVYVTPVMNTGSVVVNDNLALQGSVNALASSVEANASAISANASAISSMASSISAVAGSLTVSGIGCSTIVMSGTYADSTSFAYNFVIQPSE